LSQIKCRLCKQEKKLIDAHIIPDFMYEYIFASGGIVKTSSKFKKSRKIPTGVYDSTILCGECDNDIINRKYENYASKIYKVLSRKLAKFGSIKVGKKVKRAGMAYTPITGLDCQRFKLFLLSILWRASISSQDFCSNVKLEEHEEIIRGMIKKEDKKKLDSFPILIYDLSTNIRCLKEATDSPRRFAPNLYMFLIEGIVYFFFLSKSNLSPSLMNMVSASSTELRIYDVPKGKGVGISFVEYFKRRYFGGK